MDTGRTHRRLIAASWIVLYLLSAMALGIASVILAWKLEARQSQIGFIQYCIEIPGERERNPLAYAVVAFGVMMWGMCLLGVVTESIRGILWAKRKLMRGR